MSDLIDLESPTPPEPSPAAPVEATVPEPVTATQEQIAPVEPEDAEATELPDGTVVMPRAAVHAMRERIRQLKPLADKTTQLENKVAELTPYAAFVQANPQLFQRAAEPPQAPAPINPANDPELVEIAQLQDYYKPDGSLNLDRAAKYRELINRKAEQIARQAVQPIEQQSYQARAAANYQRTLQVKDGAGRQVKPEVVRQLFSNLPAHLTADPNVANLLGLIAIGANGMANPLPQNPAAPTRPPVMTESQGTPPARAGKPMNEFERTVVADRGIDEKKYQKLTENYRPGRTTVLED